MSKNGIRRILGIKVKELRQQKGYTQQQLAKRATLSTSYLNEIEKGKKYPRPEKLEALANALEVNLVELINVDQNDLRTVQELYKREIQDFPFNWFGVTLDEIILLINSDPIKRGGLLRMVGDLIRTYAINRSDIFGAALRAYPSGDKLFLEPIEKEAAAFRVKHGWSPDHIIRSDDLHKILVTDYGYEIDERSLAEHPYISGVRYIYIKGDHPMLYLGGNLLDIQKAFIFAYEIYLSREKKKARPVDHLRKAQTMQEAINNYLAKYFAEALLLDYNVLCQALEELFKQVKWDEEAFLKCANGTSPGIFLHRVAVVASHHFGLENVNFVRFNHDMKGGQGIFRIEMEDNLSHLPNFISVRDQHFCRRFRAIRSLRELQEIRLRDNSEELIEEIRSEMEEKGVSTKLGVGVHKSSFVGRWEGDDKDKREYFVIALAYPRDKDIDIAYSLMFEMTDKFTQIVKFSNKDNTIHNDKVALTCERCWLKGEDEDENEKDKSKICKERATYAGRPHSYVGRPNSVRWQRVKAIIDFIKKEKGRLGLTKEEDINQPL